MWALLPLASIVIWVILAYEWEEPVVVVLGLFVSCIVFGLTLIPGMAPVPGEVKPLAETSDGVYLTLAPDGEYTYLIEGEGYVTVEDVVRVEKAGAEATVEMNNDCISMMPFWQLCNERDEGSIVTFPTGGFQVIG